MGYSRVSVVAVLAAIALPVNAECFICDDEITLSGPHARCFLDNFDLIADHITQQAEGYRLVDLARCAGAAGQGMVWRGGLAQMDRPDLATDPDTAPPVQTKSAYILDLDRAECLRQRLEQVGEALDQTVSIDLAAECGQ